MSSNETSPRARMVIEAIDALRARKARPDQERIVHWVHRRYGFTKEAVVKTIENSVRDGSVIRVKYKDSISYRNPAKITRGSGTFNPIAPKDSWPEMKSSTVKSVIAGGQQASAVVSVRKPSVGPPIDAAKRVLRVIRQIMLARQSDHGDGTNGTSTPDVGSSEQASKGASTTVLGASTTVLGASIQDILTTLEHQKQQGFTAEFVKPLLTRAVAHGTVRLLPNGNYVIAGTNTDKHLIMAKRGLSKSPTKLKNVGHRSHAGSSLIASGGNRSQPPTLVKMAAASPISANKRRLSDTSGTTSETSSMSKGKGRGKKATATVTSAPTPQRVRPVSQRKKFKKTLGPDFLEPSDLGMPFLTNTQFDPVCDHCHKPSVNSKEQLLSCKDCEYKAHPSCLGYSKALTQRCLQAPWQCMYCKTCCACEGLTDLTDKKSDLMLLCDMCDQGYHMECHDPPITSKPSGSWACTPCTKLASKKSLSVRSGHKKHSVQVEIQATDSDPGFEDNDNVSLTSFDSGENSSISEEVIFPKRKDNLDKIFMNLKPSFEEVIESNPGMGRNPKDWSIDEVESFIKAIGYAEQASLFKDQEVDGVSLLLLKRSDVISGLTMKMGPALKIYGHIQRLQTVTPSSDEKPTLVVEETTSEVTKSEDIDLPVPDQTVSDHHVQSDSSTPVECSESIDDTSVELPNGQVPA